MKKGFTNSCYMFLDLDGFQTNRLEKQELCLEGPGSMRILPILDDSRKINNPPNSETQKVRLRNSENPSQTISGSFGVGAKGQNTTFTVVGRIFGVFVPDSFGKNWAALKLRLKNSETQTQWFSEFPSRTFRVSESDFPSFRS